MARIFTFRDITIKGTTTLQKESCLRRGRKVSSIANQLTQIKLPDDTLVYAAQIDCEYCYSSYSNPDLSNPLNIPDATLPLWRYPLW